MCSVPNGFVFGHKVVEERVGEGLSCAVEGVVKSGEGGAVREVEIISKASRTHEPI